MNGTDVGKMSPLGDRVLLKALEAATKTDGGVILATEEAEKPTLGKVSRFDGKSGEQKKQTTKKTITKEGMTKFSQIKVSDFPSPPPIKGSGLRRRPFFFFFFFSTREREREKREP